MASAIGVTFSKAGRIMSSKGLSQRAIAPPSSISPSHPTPNSSYSSQTHHGSSKCVDGKCNDLAVTPRMLIATI